MNNIKIVDLINSDLNQEEELNKFIKDNKGKHNYIVFIDEDGFQYNNTFCSSCGKDISLCKYAESIGDNLFWIGISKYKNVFSKN